MQLYGRHLHKLCIVCTAEHTAGTDTTTNKDPFFPINKRQAHVADAFILDTSRRAVLSFDRGKPQKVHVSKGHIFPLERQRKERENDETFFFWALSLLAHHFLVCTIQFLKWSCQMCPHSKLSLLCARIGLLQYNYCSCAMTFSRYTFFLIVDNIQSLFYAWTS